MILLMDLSNVHLTMSGLSGLRDPELALLLDNPLELARTLEVERAGRVVGWPAKL